MPSFGLALPVSKLITISKRKRNHHAQIAKVKLRLMIKILSITLNLKCKDKKFSNRCCLRALVIDRMTKIQPMNKSCRKYSHGQITSILQTIKSG